MYILPLATEHFIPRDDAHPKKHFPNLNKSKSRPQRKSKVSVCCTQSVMVTQDNLLLYYKHSSSLSGAPQSAINKYYYLITNIHLNAPSETFCYCTTRDNSSRQWNIQSYCIRCFLPGISLRVMWYFTQTWINNSSRCHLRRLHRPQDVISDAFTGPKMSSPTPSQAPRWGNTFQQHPSYFSLVRPSVARLRDQMGTGMSNVVFFKRIY
jgi:hypothetical protein